MHEFQPTNFGDYILQDRIGAGGMAEIFLATAQGIEGFEKRLVIKRILPTLSDDEQFVRMFVEEAKLCVSLHHPNIVQVYDLGLIDGQYYIAMEYVDGRDLLKTLAACGRKKIGFPTDIALFIIMEVLKGLEYAHNLTKDGLPLGIIHRDVSPSNVLLSFEGEVKLGDFGIAKARTRERTATGILKGKFGYMAPEQVTGVPIDYKADIFAVGILLYELLTGHRLFAGKNDLAVLERVRNADISPPPRHYRPDLDYELEHIVLKALDQDPRQRFQSCVELHDAIHDYVFRSRATVGPGQLGRFMQALFLTDPEELSRRQRVRLPPIPGASGLMFGPDDTEDEVRARQRISESTREDRPRLNSSITGRELLDAPLIAHRRPTPDRLEIRQAVEAIRQARKIEPSATGSAPPSDSIERSVITARGDSEPQIRDIESTNGFSPSEIVERAANPSDTDIEMTVNDIEPTVRYNPERILPSLNPRPMSVHESTETTAPPLRYNSLKEGPTQLKTVEVEQSDLPTADFDHMVVKAEIDKPSPPVNGTANNTPPAAPPKLTPEEAEALDPAGTSSTAELDVLPPSQVALSPVPPPVSPQTDGSSTKSDEPSINGDEPSANVREESYEDLGQTLHTVDQQEVIERIMGQLPPPVDSEAETSTDQDDMLTDHDPEAMIEDISDISAPLDIDVQEAVIEDPADRTIAGGFSEVIEFDTSSIISSDMAVDIDQSTKPIIDTIPPPASEEPTRRGIKTQNRPIDTEPDDPPHPDIIHEVWNEATHGYDEVDETEVASSKTQPNRYVEDGLADESTMQGSFDAELGSLERIPWVADAPIEHDLEDPSVASVDLSPADTAVKKNQRKPSPGELVPTRRDSAPPIEIPSHEPKRRYASSSVVLYGYDEDGPETADLALEYDGDPSVQGIIDEGRLGDAGASGLFGALSILDERPPNQTIDEEETDGRGFAAEPKVPPSIERSVNAMFADFSESMGRVRALSEVREENEASFEALQNGTASDDSRGLDTRMGDLADPLDEVHGLPNFQLDREESFRGFRNDDELSIRDGADLPELDAHSLVRAAPSSNVAGLRLELGEVSADPTSSIPPEGHVIDSIPVIAGRRASEPDPRASSNQPTPLDGLGEDGSWRSNALEDVLSESFELKLEESIVAPNAKRTQSLIPRGASAEPVRPVSMVRAPGGVEETGHRPLVSGSSRGGSAALRAVVGRRGKIRELNRAQPFYPPSSSDDRSTPIVMPIRSSGPAQPERARGTPGQPERARGTPGRNRGFISPRGPFGTPGVASGSGPSWLGTPSARALLARPRSRWLAMAVFGLPLLAVVLTVAALVSSVVNQRQLGDPGRVIPVPDTTDLEPNRTRQPRPPEPKNDKAAADEARTEDAPKLGTVRLKCKKATTLRIRDEGAFVANLEAVRRLRPGRYRIRLSRDGRTLRKKTIEVVAGETTKLTCP